MNTNTRPVIASAWTDAGKEMENRAWAGAAAEAMRLRMKVALRLRYTTGFPPHEVHENELSQRHRVGEVRLAAADRAHRLHELHQTPVARQHESVDENPRAAALGHLAIGGLQDLGIEPHRVHVGATVGHRERRRLAVGDHDDLP